MKKQNYLYWVKLPDKPGSIRPYLVLSIDEANNNFVIVAPVMSLESQFITSIQLRKDVYPLEKNSSIELSKILTIESKYLEEEICKLRDIELEQVQEVLKKLFSL